jgi:hypothetical protein
MTRLLGWLWQDLDVAHLHAIMTEITLAQALTTAQVQMDGRTRGRFVVNVNA